MSYTSILHQTSKFYEYTMSVFIGICFLIVQFFNVSKRCLLADLNTFRFSVPYKNKKAKVYKLKLVLGKGLVVFSHLKVIQIFSEYLLFKLAPLEGCKLPQRSWKLLLGTYIIALNNVITSSYFSINYFYSTCC